MTGTFTYTGLVSTCSYAVVNVEIVDDAWYVVSKTAGHSSNTATADLVMGQKLLGITVNKETIEMILSCDANGNLS